jgi:virulence-associated protein VapD
MFAVAFDLDRLVADSLHPMRNPGAYRDIRRTLELYGFKRVQGSTYAADHEDQARLFLALTALRRLRWFGPSLKNLRVFRMEAGADFTEIMKSELSPM